MATGARKGRQKTPSCKGETETPRKEARLVLKIMPLDKHASDAIPEELQAVGHYVNCDECRKMGLAVIVGQSVGCQDALGAHVEQTGPWRQLFGGLSQISTLREELYAEHINGRWIKSKWGDTYESDYGRCEQNACSAMWYYWKQAPLSAFYDGEKEIAGQMPFLIELFIRQGWSIQKLLALQKKRIEYLLAGLSGKGDISPYHGKEHAVRGITENMALLQKLASPVMPVTKIGLDGIE